MAAMAMQGMVPENGYDITHRDLAEEIQHIAEASVMVADALVAELDRTAPVVKESLSAEHHIPDAGKMVPECDWSQDDDGIYHSACGVSFEFIADGPEANGFHYCHHCGKVITTIKESLSVPDDDGWIDHKPGDAMPCDGDMNVDVMFMYGEASAIVLPAKTREWGRDCNLIAQIIKWRPARLADPLK